MTRGRRPLRYESFDGVMTDVVRLLDGHRTVGNWTLARIGQHLAAVLRRHVGLPASTVFNPSDRISDEERRRMLESGVLPAGIEAPPGVLPEATRGEREEAEGLRAAIACYRASPGPATPHRIFGPKTRDEWGRFELAHLAHHLSFAVPTTTDGGRRP